MLPSFPLMVLLMASGSWRDRAWLELYLGMVHTHQADFSLSQINTDIPLANTAIYKNLYHFCIHIWLAPKETGRLFFIQQNDSLYQLSVYSCGKYKKSSQYHLYLLLVMSLSVFHSLWYKHIPSHT